MLGILVRRFRDERVEQFNEFRDAPGALSERLIK